MSAWTTAISFRAPTDGRPIGSGVLFPDIMGSPCLLSRRRPSCSSISAKPTAGMKPYHRGLLQARANGEVKPSDARVGRTDHTTWPLGVWFWSMQKTHLRQTSRTHRIPPLPAPHPVYAEITCLLHTVRAMPVGGKSVIRTRSCRPSFSRHTCTNLLPTLRRKPAVVIPRTMQPWRSARIMPGQSVRRIRPSQWCPPIH